MPKQSFRVPQLHQPVKTSMYMELIISVASYIVTITLTWTKKMAKV